MNQLSLIAFSIICILYPVCQASAQDHLPILRANSPSLSVRDGIQFKEHIWRAEPDQPLDIYFTEMPRKPHRVTFISDLDSISFEVSYGGTYDFVVLLNETDSSLTRIAANYHGVNFYQEDVEKPDTIPFTLRGSRIYFDGTVNSNPGISFQFDLGAGMSAINRKSVEKAGVTFDGSTMLSNSDGLNEAPTASSNRLSIAGLNWEQVPMVQAGNMDSHEDVIIGNPLFEHKVIEIDYDRQLMILHDTLAAVPPGYTRHALIYHQHRPFIEATVVADGKAYTDWFLFDTGRDGTMVLREGFFVKNPIWDKLTTVFWLGQKRVKVIPAIQIGALEFTDVISPAYSPSHPDGGAHNILGNELLNHFNVIVDNPNGWIYLKPNHLEDKEYENWNSFRDHIVMAGFAAAALLLLLMYGIRRFLNRKKQHLSLP